MYEIRLKPGMPYRYMQLIDPSMEVTREWQPIAEITREVEQRVKLGHFEVSERSDYNPLPFTETKRAAMPAPAVTAKVQDQPAKAKKKKGNK